MINLLIVDDHKIVRTGLKRILADTIDIKIVAECDSGEQAIQFCREHPIDVALIDIHMPGIGGLEAARRLLQLVTNLKILVLTSSEDEVFPLHFLRAGAKGYLTKDCDPEELVRAIHTLARGEKHLGANVAQMLALRQLDDKHSPFDDLSERELQVMLMVAQGIKVPEIAKKLFLSTKTVNTYRYRVFEKLNVKTDIEVIKLAMQYGLIDSPSAVEKEVYAESE